ncbi:MAG: RNA polymerase sigma factor [Oscillospiraceae bacterium]|nr:RNA polymerase sigma factor [Oscillospiraceae bacterium]
MNKAEFDEKIADISKSILSYCVARTSNRYDAEDLAQDIITELVKSVDNIRDDKAFYGFMWAVAGKVYAMWSRKKAKGSFYELPDDLTDDTDYFDIDGSGDLYSLRRELTLLSEKYRKAVILYYLENKSCSEISSILNISESMVKYLLFKARKILKEGMNMERNYGEQSYNPKNLTLLYMGEGPNKFWSITDGKKIPQNILWACYNDSLTAEEISLQIGVALPYLEAELKTLEDAGLLIQKGGRYSTNVIIFSNEFKTEINTKIEKQQETIADTIYNFIIGNEEKIKAIGFYMNDMSKNSFMWHISCVTLWVLFGKITEKDYPFEKYPTTAFGEKAFVWADESPGGVFNICGMSRHDKSLDEGEIRFLDYLPKPKSENAYFYRNQKLANFFMRLASGKVENPNEYEKEFMADLIAHGYVFNNNGKISVTTPVYTGEQIHELYSLLSPMVEELLVLTAEIQQTVRTVLKNHIPSHLKQQIDGIVCMRMFDEVIGKSGEIMCRKDYLKTSWNAREMPTVYVVLE